VLRPALALLFVGINPGLLSAREGRHFANPSNAFWRLLHEAGFTPRRLAPREQESLLDRGIGITNLVPRATPGVAELGASDMARGRVELARKISRYRPRAVVFVGITAYRAFAQKPSSVRIACGEQPERFAEARVFVVPNPSGRNAHFTYAQMLVLYRAVAQDLGLAPD
jgi:TDG/mug DNA glycosylase family protein